MALVAPPLNIRASLAQLVLYMFTGGFLNEISVSTGRGGSLHLISLHRCGYGGVVEGRGRKGRVDGVGEVGGRGRGMGQGRR